MRVLRKVLTFEADCSKQVIMTGRLELLCPFTAASNVFGPTVVAAGLVYRGTFIYANVQSV